MFLSSDMATSSRPPSLSGAAQQPSQVQSSTPSPLSVRAPLVPSSALAHVPTLPAAAPAASVASAPSIRSDIPEVLLSSHYGALISSFFDEGVLLSAVDKQQIIGFYLDRCLLPLLLFSFSLPPLPFLSLPLLNPHLIALLSSIESRAAASRAVSQSCC
jgi:hypothetical protein